MAIVPATVVPAPEPRGLRYGLLTAANGPLDLPSPHGRGGGVMYEPVSCGVAHRYPVECDDTPAAKVFDPAATWVEADPFVVYATHVCSAVGSAPAELEAKVRRRLTNGEQTGAEQGLADTLEVAATPLTAPDPTSLRSVVGELEQWLYGYATAGYGNVGYLHAPPRFQAYAAAAGVVVPDRTTGPTILRTHMGTIWVFGGGYPDDDTVYISGQVTVWRSTDVLVPPPGQVFDRAANTYRLIAEREYAVAFDCFAAAADFIPEVGAS